MKKRQTRKRLKLIRHKLFGKKRSPGRNKISADRKLSEFPPIPGGIRR